MDWYMLPHNGRRNSKKLWLVSRKSDPCHVIKKANGDEPLSSIIIYVVDGGFIGTPEAIKEVVEALSKSFKVKIMGEMSKFFE
jgi:hypothetical protein